MFPQSTILGPLFWIAMGLIYSIILIGAKYWFQDLRFSMNWWKWTLTIIWFSVLSMSIAGSFTLIAENEPQAGIRFLIISIILNLVLGFIVWKLISKGQIKKQTQK